MRLRQEAIDKEKALVKYAREYIQMGDECLRVGMKDAAMRNYEKAVALCPKFKEAWTKIKKLEKEITILSEQFRYLLPADGRTLCFVIDIQQVDFCFFHSNNHRKSNDTRTTALAPAFGGDGHTDFAQAAAKVGTKMWISIELLTQIGQIGF